MKALKSLLFIGIFSCIFVFQSFSQQKIYAQGNIFITAESTHQLLADFGFRAFEPLEQPDENYPTIMIDPDKTFQTIEGFGGACTDAAAVTFGQLSKEAQEKILKACFDPVEGNGYTFWNLLLDQTGGLLHAGGVPSTSTNHNSNIITTDLNTGEVFLNPPHYTFGQFSKFIKPGAKRIACTSNSDNFIATAFVNTDGKIAVVILNLQDYEQRSNFGLKEKQLKWTALQKQL